MSFHQQAAIVAAIVLALVIGFQLLLAAGLPFGRAAWGGQHRILPMNLRLGSVGAAGILGVSAWVVLARAGMVTPGFSPAIVSIATWIFAGFFSLNTLGNLASKSRLERLVTTPATTLLVACFVTVALS